MRFSLLVVENIWGLFVALVTEAEDGSPGVPLATLDQTLSDAIAAAIGKGAGITLVMAPVDIPLEARGIKGLLELFSAFITKLKVQSLCQTTRDGGDMHFRGNSGTAEVRAGAGAACG